MYYFKPKFPQVSNGDNNGTYLYNFCNDWVTSSVCLAHSKRSATVAIVVVNSLSVKPRVSSFLRFLWHIYLISRSVPTSASHWVAYNSLGIGSMVVIPLNLKGRKLSLRCWGILFCPHYLNSCRMKMVRDQYTCSISSMYMFTKKEEGTWGGARKN